MCGRCQNDELIDLDDTRGVYVCVGCGAVVDREFAASFESQLESRPLAPEGDYKRKFYRNEVLLALSNGEPRIPRDLRILISVYAYRYMQEEGVMASDLGYREVHEILKRVEVPTYLREKHKTRNGKPLVSLTKFLERWVQIRCFIGRERPPPIPDWMFTEWRAMYDTAERYFEECRHNPLCPRSSSTCHRRYKCRHNFIPMDFFLVQTLYIVYKQTGDERLVQCAPWLIKKKTTVTKHVVDIWKRICERVEWPDEIYLFKIASR
jgi:hypothetical protein